MGKPDDDDGDDDDDKRRGRGEGCGGGGEGEEDEKKEILPRPSIYIKKKKCNMTYTRSAQKSKLN